MNQTRFSFLTRSLSMLGELNSKLIWVGRGRLDRADGAFFEMMEPRVLLSTYAVPSTIPSDFSAEVTADLMTFIDSVPDGTAANPSVIEFPSGGEYWIDGTLTISGRHHLSFDGNGSLFKAVDPIDPAVDSMTAYKRDQWRITGKSSNIQLFDMIIHGAHPTAGMNGVFDRDREGQAGVALEGGAHDILLDNLTISYTFGDTIEGLSSAHDIIVQNSTLEHAGRQGVSFNNNYNILFQNNYLADGKRTLIDIEPYAGSWKVDNLQIIGNTTGSSTNRWLSLGGSGFIGSVLIANNNIQGTSGLPTIVDQGDFDDNPRRGPVVVVNNTITASTSNQIDGDLQFSEVDGVVVLGNQLAFPTGSARGAGYMIRGVGSVIGNNNFANAFEDFYIGTDNPESISFDNDLSEDVNWSSDTTFTTLPGDDGYLITAPYSDASITSGEIRVLMRRNAGTEPIDGGGMTLTGDLAMVLIDGDGELVRGWTSSETARFEGKALPLLGHEPEIFTEPQGVTTASGDDATFAVVPTGSFPFAYQWYKDGVAIADATSRTYTAENVQSGDDGAEYSVVVTNLYGTVTSAAATLTVATAAAPAITSQPASTSVTEGYAATFGVSVTGSDAKHFQWQIDDGSGWVDIPGAVVDQYTTPVNAQADSGTEYRVIITNDYGSVTSATATLTVASAASVTEDWTGTNGDPWPGQWTVDAVSGGSAVTIVDDEGRVRGNGTTILHGSNAEANFSEQEATIRFSNGTGAQAGFYAGRSDGDPDTYFVARNGVVNGGGGDSLLIAKVVDGVTTGLGLVSYDVVANVDYKMRFVVEATESGNTNLRLKFWVATDPEPAEWTREVLEVNEPRLQGVLGTFGLYSKIGVNDRSVHFDDYAGSGIVGVDNTPPAASFTATATDGSAPMEVEFDASESRDADGTNEKILRAYHWDFGDGSDPATTLFPDIRHTFAQAGSYTVTLTAVDQIGATHSTSTVIDVSAAGVQIADDWTGTNGDPWGSQWTAETRWGVSPLVDIYGNEGRVRGDGFDAGGVTAYINNATAEDVEQVVMLRASAGTGLKMGLVAKRSDSNPDTYFVARTGSFAGGGGDNVYIIKVVDGVETNLGSYSWDVNGSDDMMRMSVETNANGHTDIRMKIWRAADPEPSSWSKEVLDVDDASLNGVSGRFGVYANIGVADPGRQIYFDDYDATIQQAIADDWTGTNGDPWGSQWTAETRWGVSPLVDIYGNEGRVRGDGFDAGGVTAYINNATAEDVEQVVMLRATAGTGLRMGLVAKRSDSNPDTYFVARTGSFSGGGGDNVYIVKVVDGVETNLGSYSWDVNGSEDMMRMSVETNANGHTDIRMKIWRAADPEPSSWSKEVLDVDDAALNGVSGRFGVFAHVGVADPGRRIFFDDYAASVTGGTAGGGAGTELPPVIDLPSHAQNVTATAYSYDQIDLAWSDLSDIEDGYRIERSPDGRENWITLADLPGDSTAFSDTTVSASTHYWYRIVPHNDDADTPHAVIVDATAVDAPGEVREYWTDDDYEAWPSKWSFDTGESASKVERDLGTSPKGANLLAYVNTEIAESVDQTVQIRLSNSTGAKAGIIARRADADSDTYFMARTGSTNGGGGDGVHIYKVIDGVKSEIGSVGYDVTGADTPHMMRFLVETNANGHTDLRLKFWDVGDAEPSSWMIEKLDIDEPRLNEVSGRFGLTAANGVSDREVWFDNYEADIISALRAGDVEAGGNGRSITQADLDAVAAAATQRWILAGVDVNDPRLSQLSFQVGQLDGDLLGRSAGSVITIDVDAAGLGWFVDATPLSDVEFRGARGPAGMDLLTVVTHEIGHLLGFDHGDGLPASGTLTPGVRQVPVASDSGPVLKSADFGPVQLQALPDQANDPFGEEEEVSDLWNFNRLSAHLRSVIG